jgi:hypothetical protein
MLLSRAPGDRALERGNLLALQELVTVTARDSCSGFDVRSRLLQGAEDVTFDSTSISGDSYRLPYSQGIQGVLIEVPRGHYALRVLEPA